MKSLIKKSTKNYGKFKFLPFNREYSVRKDLIDSFNKYGWLMPIICIESSIYGKKQLFILDGQHRFATASFLDLPIEYVIVGAKADKKEDLVMITAKLNSSAKQWGMGDYVNAFAALNIEDYIYLSSVHHDSGISYSSLAAFYTGGKSSSGGRSCIIRQGKFRITRMELGNSIVNCLKDLNKITSFSNRMSYGFFSFFISLGGDYDHERFCENFRNNLPMLEDISEIISYKEAFEKIYSKE